VDAIEPRKLSVDNKRWGSPPEYPGFQAERRDTIEIYKKEILSVYVAS
jgi:hypothetical protein